ncbi:MAG: DUF294 nucleotidyltransferase-like domain-containing protein [Mobilicoccus sp.]|nr:DUF294 nucleotidyltransferase-like domain-containing protein [Mobilicoccus sp.]
MEHELVEIRDFLAEQAPFADLSADVLSTLPSRITVRYHRRGQTILRPDDVIDSFFLVRSGAVDIHDRAGGLVERVDVGDSFGVNGLLQPPPYGFVATAVEDTLVFVIGEPTFRELLGHGAVSSFFLMQQAGRLRAAAESVRSSDNGGAVLRTRVIDMVAKDPIALPPETPVQELAATMRDLRISSVLIQDEQGALCGIVTDRDLRNRVVAAGLGYDTLAREVMTADPVVIGADALALEALMEMLGRGIHHLPVLDHGRPVGLVTSTDLVRLERSNPLYLVQDVSRQTDAEGLAQIAARLPSLVEDLVSQDATAGDISRLISAVADAIHRRLIALGVEKLGPAPVPYCWVVLGSQARHESGLGGDQDTALILDDTAGPEHVDYFADLARFVTDGLITCGYPACPGDVMATNPRWRQSLATWKRTFREWIEEPTPDAVLGATIFFDMRPVAGEADLFEELRRDLLARTPRAANFLAHLAKQAVDHQPPLSLFRGFVLDKGGAEASSLDLKHRGVGPVVDLARVHALSLGAPAVETRARLGAARLERLISENSAADLLAAFEFISHLRLRHQAGRVREGLAPNNHVPPGTLTAFEKRTLKDAFGVVRTGQSVLGQRHPVGFVS